MINKPEACGSASIAHEASDGGLLSPDLAAGIRRVKGSRRLGVRIGNWLTAEEGRRIIRAFDTSTPQHRKNRALIPVLIGCGLGSAEAAVLKLEDIADFSVHDLNMVPSGDPRHGAHRSGVQYV